MGARVIGWPGSREVFLSFIADHSNMPERSKVGYKGKEKVFGYRRSNYFQSNPSSTVWYCVDELRQSEFNTALNFSLSGIHEPNVTQNRITHSHQELEVYDGFVSSVVHSIPQWFQAYLLIVDQWDQLSPSQYNTSSPFGSCIPLREKFKAVLNSLCLEGYFSHNRDSTLHHIQ